MKNLRKLRGVMAVAFLLGSLVFGVSCRDKTPDAVGPDTAGIKTTADANPAPTPGSDPVQSGALAGMKVSGPYTEGNLALFLIHGEDKAQAKAFLTLDEALGQKKVVVYETGNVQELSIENLSETEEVYLQSGEIVRGGRQDRLIVYDQVLPVKSGKVPLASRCVEHGRWSARQGEQAGVFNSSKNAVGNNVSIELRKMVTKNKVDQGKVWEEVSKAQENMSGNLNANVKDARSATSMELTLDSEAVRKAVDKYMEKFMPLIEKEKDVVGFAVAVNGQIVSVDTYGSNALFRKLSKKLVQSVATQALSELKKDENYKTPEKADLDTFVTQANQGEKRQMQVNPASELSIQGDEKHGVIECKTSAKEEALHRTYH